MISRRKFIESTVFSTTAAIMSGKSLVMNAFASDQEKRVLRFGANYVPRKNWWYCWLDWDQAAVTEDLRGIAGLGLDHIRIQCLWPFFEPGPNTISRKAITNLRLLLDAADSFGLDVQVTVLNGWMSGLAFFPAWVAPVGNLVMNRNQNMFTSLSVIDSEKLLFQAIAESVGNHPRFLGFDIGNELTVLQGQGDNPVSIDEADTWAGEILRFCDQIAPGKFHVNGVDHQPWFNDFGFSREQLAKQGSASVVHSYPLFTGASDRYRYSDPGSLHLAEYMVELAYAYSAELSRPVWVEETGAAAKDMPVEYEPEFMEHTVRNIAATGKAWGVTWWGSHDIDPNIKGFEKLEYSLGLLDIRNNPKPIGRKFAQLAQELKYSPSAVTRRTTALVVPDRGLAAKNWPPDWTYATPFMKLIERGESPAIVLESRASDENYLSARGITKLVRIAS
jgi:hypothetical protein